MADQVEDQEGTGDKGGGGKGRGGVAGNEAASSTKPPATLLPKSALNAADDQIARVAEILTTAANGIEALLDNKALPLNNTIREFVVSSAGKIRDLANRATEKEAADLMVALQRAAANNPAATAGVGATIGASLGVALVALGVRNSEADSKEARAD
jgi:hypothetical protein